MERLSIGDVITLPFTYADFSSFKTRPALIVGKAEFDNLILCQITSKSYTSKIAIGLNDSEFENGGLSLVSYIRPDKIFTVEKSIVISKVGRLSNGKIQTVKAAVQHLFD